MHCLECGTQFHVGESSCPSCGNDKNILPARWTPPDSRSFFEFFSLGLNNETRILAAMSLALICALWLLGSARARSTAALTNKSDSGVEMVRADLTGETRADDLELTGEPVNSPDLDEIPVDISEARLMAHNAEEMGMWFDAVDAWSMITRHESAEFDDFIALANANRMVNDTLSARSALNRAVVRFPDRPEGYLAFGELEESLGSLNAARFQYQVGLSYCPGNIDFIEKLHAVETELGFIEEIPPEPFIEEEPPGTPDITVTDEGVIIELVVPVIEPEPVPPSEIETQPIPVEPEIIPEPEPEPEIEEDSSESDGNVPVTLIGASDPDVPATSDPDVEELTDETETEEFSVVEVLDLEVSATTERVSITLLVDSPAAFSTSTASEPSRLIVRVPNAQIAEGSGIIRDININVPLVDRVHLGEGASDTSTYVILVIYLGEDVRHSVSADAQSVRVSIGKDPGSEAG